MASEVECDCFKLVFDLQCPDCCPDGLHVVAHQDGCHQDGFCGCESLDATYGSLVGAKLALPK